ncbi:MAG: hypothetical protein ACJAZ3_000367 [Sphingobacteriales bacterium]|jgi:hypothetical protein
MKYFLTLFSAILIFSATTVQGYNSISNDYWWENIASDSPDKVLVQSNFYPNPVEQNLNVSLEFDKPGRLNISIYNVIGKQVAELTNETITQNSYFQNFFIDFEMPRGMYFVKVTFDEEVVAVKRINKK